MGKWCSLNSGVRVTETPSVKVYVLMQHHVDTGDGSTIVAVFASRDHAGHYVEHNRGQRDGVFTVHEMPVLMAPPATP